MYRVLIVDYDKDFAQLLHRQICNGFAVECCNDMDTAMELLYRFEPDVIVIDAFLSGLNGWSILQILADTGRTPHVIVTTRNTQPYLLNGFVQQGVKNLFVKPCKIGALAACINELCAMSDHATNGAWCVENEIDNILLRLNFQIGTKAYNALFQAIILRYENMDATVTKHIYPQIAKMYGAETAGIERLIRYTIKTAFCGSDMNIWKCFFQPGPDGTLPCPSNDVFIGRIAGCLRQRERIKPPYKLLKQKNA